MNENFLTTWEILNKIFLSQSLNVEFKREDGTSVAKLPIPTGGFKLGDVILFNIRRSPNSVGDTYPNDALFIKAALHVPTNDFGSRQRYLK